MITDTISLSNLSGVLKIVIVVLLTVNSDILGRISLATHVGRSRQSRNYTKHGPPELFPMSDVGAQERRGPNLWQLPPTNPLCLPTGLPAPARINWGKLFYLQLELFCLQLSFFAYSPLRPSLDALSHCKQKSSNCK